MLNNTYLRRITLIITLFIISSISLSAGTFTATSNGNWSSPATWSSASIPTASDNVVITNGAVVTVDINNAVCKSLQLGNNGGNHGNGTLVFNTGSIVTVGNGVTFGKSSNQGSLDMTNGGLFQIGGTVNISKLGTFTPGTGTIEYNGNATQNIIQTASLGNQPYYNLTVSGSNTKTLGGAVTVSGTLSIADGTTLSILNNTLTLNGNLTVIGSGNILGGNTSNLSIGGSGTDILLPSITNGLNNLILNRNNNISISNNPLALNGTLTISSGSLTVPSVNSMTVKGNTTLTGTECLILKSDASGTASFIDNGTINGTGTARVERYLTTAAWHFVSSPISNALSGVFLHDYIRTSDPTSSSGWTPYITSTTDPLQVMRGYSCWKPNNNSSWAEVFSGNLNTGNQSFTGNRNPSDPYAGWHLAGNPYPSTIDLSKGVTWGQFEGTAYFWHQGESGGSYTNGNYDAYPAKSGFGTHSQYVPPMQGFYIHIKNTFTGNTTLSINNTSRVTISANFLKETSALTDGLLIVATGNQNEYSDKITVHFDPEATDDYDPGYDAEKLTGYSDAPQIYTKSGDEKLTCNALPFSQENMTVPMGFYCSLPGQYTFTADSLGTFASSVSIYLEDLKLNSSQDLRQNPVYTFTYDTTDNADRFLLHFSESNFGVQEISPANNTRIYSWQDAIYVQSNNSNISGDLFVYDFLGKELYHASLRNDPVSRYVPGLPQGYYIVRVVTGNSAVNQKVFLK